MFCVLIVIAYINYVLLSLQPKYLERLRSIRDTLKESSFFRSHELIGSSLLFVHDKRRASIWMIDFAKTVPVPDNVSIDHNSVWKVGNHEDGYLIGLNNLISIFQSLSKDDNGNIDQCYSDVTLEKNVRKDNFDTWSIKTWEKSHENWLCTVMLYCYAFSVVILSCTDLMACLCDAELSVNEVTCIQCENERLLCNACVDWEALSWASQKHVKWDGLFDRNRSRLCTYTYSIFLVNNP